MTDETKLRHTDGVQVTEGAATAPSAADAQARNEAMKKDLADRKAHLAELEKRVKRDDYSPEKLAQYRAALARASADVKAREKELNRGND